MNTHDISYVPITGPVRLDFRDPRWFFRPADDPMAYLTRAFLRVKHTCPSCTLTSEHMVEVSVDKTDLTPSWDGLSTVPAVGPSS